MNRSILRQMVEWRLFVVTEQFGYLTLFQLHICEFACFGKFWRWTGISAFEWTSQKLCMIVFSIIHLIVFVFDLRIELQFRQVSSCKQQLNSLRFDFLHESGHNFDNRADTNEHFHECNRGHIPTFVAAKRFFSPLFFFERFERPRIFFLCQSNAGTATALHDLLNSI